MTIFVLTRTVSPQKVHLIFKEGRVEKKFLRFFKKYKWCKIIVISFTLLCISLITFCDFFIQQYRQNFSKTVFKKRQFVLFIAFRSYMKSKNVKIEHNPFLKIYYHFLYEKIIDAHQKQKWLFFIKNSAIL